MSREIAYELLFRVAKEDAYANLLLPTLIRRAKLDSRDAAFVQELAYGTIRNQLLYDRIIERASGRRINEIELKALLVLRLGVHQLCDMRVPTHAAINESVELAKAKTSKAAAGFVNVVLRKTSSRNRGEWVELLTKDASTPDESLSIRYSHPTWIVRALKAALASRGIEGSIEELLSADNLAAKVSICAIPSLSTVSDLIKEGVSPGPVSPIGGTISGNPAAIQAVRDGLARVQDQGSQLVTLALTRMDIAIEDSNWLDVCAGPGGKAALMAGEARNNGAQLVCNEVQLQRLNLVKQALLPFGTEMCFLNLDGREMSTLPQKYSRILLDAPCTGLGALRRRPEARWRKSSSDLAELTKLQRELFISAWNCLFPGGVMAYVTCSPHLSETTAQVAWAEAKLGNELELVNANKLLNQISPSLKLDENFLTAQLWPHLHQTDAMFIALFRKRLG